MMSNLCTPWGISPQKNLGGGEKIFPNPLGSGGVVQNFPGNSPWKEVPEKKYPKLVSEFWGLPRKKISMKLAQISWFSNFFAHFSKMVRGVANLKTDF